MSFQIEHNILKKYIEENGVTEVTVPEGVTEIGDRAFQNCQSLTSIHLPDSVTKIAEGAFSGCKTLTNVRIPDSVTKIAEGAFLGCKTLTNVRIPDSVTEIERVAFAGCEHLTSVHLPDSVTKIGECAFALCKHLTNVHLSSNVTTIEYQIFGGCDNLTTILVDIPISENGEKVKISLISEKNFSDLFPEENCSDLVEDKFFVVGLINQINMLRTKNFSVNMETEIKYMLLCRFLVLCPEMPELVAYMKKYFKIILTFAIEYNLTEAICIMLNWHLLNQGNIDNFIRLAIDHTQKTGNPEIQLTLTEYKYKHIGFKSIEDKFKL